MIDASVLEEMLDKEIMLEYDRKTTLKSLISLAKKNDKDAKKLLEEILARGEDYFNALEYIIDDTINKHNSNMEKEAEKRLQEHRKYLQECAERRERERIAKIEALKELEEARKAEEKRRRELEKARKEEEERRRKELEEAKKAKKELKKQREAQFIKNLLTNPKNDDKSENKEFLNYKKLYFNDTKLPNQEFDLGRLVILARKGNQEAKNIAGLVLFKRAYEIAKEFSNCGFNIEFEDLLQEAMIGLNDYLTENNYAKKRYNNEALERIRYNNEVLERIPRELNGFESTIICAIIDGIKYSSQYGIDIKDIANMILYKRTSDNLFKELGFEPTNELISEDTNWQTNEVDYTQKLMQPTVSINNISEDELAMRSPDYDISNTNTEDTVMRNIEYEMICQIIKEIDTSDRNKEIFIRSYKEDLTLEKIAKEYNITKERVRQIEAKVLKLIRKKYQSYKYKYKSDYRDHYKLIEKNRIF